MSLEMQSTLTLHPKSSCDAVAKIDVRAERRTPCELRLHYLATGRIPLLRTPSRAAPARADELWNHTCFEAFLRIGSGSTYYEFNFSPSTEWAIYAFDDYRRGMTAILNLAAPRIEPRSSPELYELEVLQTLNEKFAHDSWHLGLSAVIEQTDGRKSYWALAHPPGRPDFHHANCFALELPRP